VRVAIESRNCVTCKEENCFFKRHAKPDWLGMLGDQKTTYAYSKGDIIFQAGDPLTGMYSVHFGAIKEIVSLGKEETQILSFSSAGLLVGFRGLGGDQTNYLTTAIALNDVELVYFPIQLFNIAMNANPLMMESLLKLCIDDLNRSEMKSRYMLKASAEERVISVLNYLVKVFGYSSPNSGKLSFTPTRRDLVNFSGLTYETFTRALLQLKKRGVIDFDQKELILLR
jgi:CRP-like cAMP-binding protein